MTQEQFLNVALPQLPNVHGGMQSAVKMLEDSKQQPGNYLVLTRFNGESLPGMFVEVSAVGQPRDVLAEKLEASFPDLIMAKDVLCVRVELK